MNAFAKRIVCVTTLGTTLAMAAVTAAGQGQQGKGSFGGNGGQNNRSIQVVGRGQTQVTPLNTGNNSGTQTINNHGINPGTRIGTHTNGAGQSSNGGQIFNPNIRVVDPKKPLPINSGIGVIDPKHTLPFNPNNKIPLDPNKKPVLPLDPNGPKIPLGPNKPIDHGFGNGSHGHSHGGLHSWCGGICHPHWVCPTIWWYPSSCFCCNLTGGYFTAPVVTVVAGAPALDVALVDVRFCDSGDAASKLGPRYRVTIRNKSLVDAGQFHMVVMAGMDNTPKPDAPASLVKVVGLMAGETKAFDVRLPVDSLKMAVDSAGNAVPFVTLFVAVDSHEELNDVDRTNNGTVMNRVEIPLVN